MGNDMSSVLVNGRKMSFKGNFGFKINNQEYYTKNGRVYNTAGQPMKELKMKGYMAEQFFAMSAIGESVQDNTFSSCDVQYAEAYQQSTTNGTNTIDVALRSQTGSGGKVVAGHNNVENGVFTSQYKSNESGKTSTISVWLNE